VKDGRDGVGDGAPYDRIVVTASAEAIPLAWYEQLAPDGRLQVPIVVSSTGTQAIALLRRAGERRMRSVSALAGGFMPLRGADGAAPPAAWPPALVAAERDGRRETQLREVHGAAVGTLSEGAKRRLLAIALDDPRRVPLGMRAAGPALTLFLTLTLPPRRLVMSAPRFGLGAIAYGTDEAERLVLDRVADWDARGRPGAADLRITVRYDERGASRVTARWPRPAGS
jgi:Protein-L-isoaspartate(D-aspartate) O-methyltransferase (PCMT)